MAEGTIKRLTDKGFGFNTAGMKEQVLVGTNVDEPKTFVSKSLDSAFGHYVS